MRTDDLPLDSDLIRYFRSQTKLALPFREFGYTGGYGDIRGGLVDSIEEKDWAAAFAQFAALVAQTREELEEEANKGPTPGAICPTCGQTMTASHQIGALWYWQCREGRAV